MQFGTGFLDSPFNEKDYDFGLQDVFGSTPVGNENWRLKDLLTPTGNQFNTQSCTIWGAAEVMWVNQGAFGVPMDLRVFPSILSGYYRARARKWGYDAIFDVGSGLHHAWEAWRHGGIIREQDYPFDPSLVNAEPPPHLFRKAADEDWLNYRWMLDPPGSRERRIKQTIDHDRALTVAVEVDESFEQWQLSHGPWRRKYKAKGSHLMALWGYEAAGGWCKNSHGTKFGEGGLILVDWRYLESPECRGYSTAEFDVEKFVEFMQSAR